MKAQRERQTPPSSFFIDEFVEDSEPFVGERPRAAAACACVITEALTTSFVFVFLCYLYEEIGRLE